MNADFDYLIINKPVVGLTVSFFPNNQQAIEVYNEISKQNDDTMTFYISQFENVKKQLTSAGCTLNQLKKENVTLDEILQD